LASALHPLEFKVLSSIADDGWVEFDRLVAKTGLQPDQVRRALAWLSSKKLVETRETETTTLSLTATKLPELTLVDSVQRAGGSLSFDALRAALDSDQEFSAALGRARSAGWIGIEAKGPSRTVRLTNSAGPAELRELVTALGKGADESSLAGTQRRLLQDLLKRGIVVRSTRKTVAVTITAAGKQLSSLAPSADYIEKLTPEALSTGSWRGRRLRPLDVEAEAPRFYPGKRHPVRDFIREVREAYISMGFIELEGNSVQPAFWNFDALFIPQDHPGREMQDTFYLKGFSDDKIQRSGIVAKVADTHEDGWTTGSKGWRYRWQIEEARRLVLRTHNTVLTVRALSESGEKETRVFAVSKVYRNENLDYKHLVEFHQMDGIMVGNGLNVKHLMGFLAEFYKKLGMKGVKFWPTYFPYTEPSLEVVGYSEAAKDWIELSGSGVFRPEVTRPLGVKVPVLAWGPGIERIMLFRYGLDDMRALYGGDLGWLRRRVEFASSNP
jgi:phenylalanyl-tRNA synthetase alpha chain